MGILVCILQPTLWIIMYRAIVFFTVAMGFVAADTNTYAMPQDQYAAARQGFGGQASLGLGPFGEINAGGNLQVPSGTENFLVNAIIALGVLSLIQTAATVAVPWFLGTSADGDTEGERRELVDNIRDTVMGYIQNAI